MKRGQRKPATRLYKPVIYILPEGRLTERSYFDALSRFISFRALPFSVSFQPSKHSNIESLLKTAKSVERRCHEHDQIWILVDRDGESNRPVHFDMLGAWQREAPGRRHVALSNPRFEYWLLLHFEEHPTLDDSNTALTSYFPNYEKSKSVARSISINEARVREAIKRAEASKLPDCDHIDIIGSGVGELVKLFFQSSS